MQLNTLFIGRSHVHLEETGSTNDVARELLGMRPAEGTLITARRQTSGRGQKGHSWHSEPDTSLTFSVILYPAFLSPGRIFGLQEAVTLAVCDAVASFLPGKDVMIKWPNDIVVDGKKIAGILLETSVEGAQIQWAIAGIGINVGNTSFPDLPGRQPTSLLLEGTVTHTEAVLSRLLTGLESMYLRLRTGKYAWFREAFEANMYRRGAETVFLTPEGGEISAQIEGISDDGRLCLKSGETSTLYFPETIQWKT